MKQRNGSTTAPPNGVAKGMAELTRDTISLSELQFELFRIDCREDLQRMLLPVTALLIAGMVAAGSVPIALLLITELLAEATGLSRSVALTIAALSGFLIAAAIGFVGWSYLRRVVRVFERSREELARNMTWIKHALKRPAPIDTEQSQDRSQGV